MKILNNKPVKIYLSTKKVNSFETDLFTNRPNTLQLQEQPYHIIRSYIIQTLF